MEIKTKVWLTDGTPDGVFSMAKQRYIELGNSQSYVGEQMRRAVFPGDYDAVASFIEAPFPDEAPTQGAFIPTTAYTQVDTTGSSPTHPIQKRTQPTPQSQSAKGNPMVSFFNNYWTEDMVSAYQSTQKSLMGDFAATDDMATS